MENHNGIGTIGIYFTGHGGSQMLVSDQNEVRSDVHVQWKDFCSVLEENSIQFNSISITVL